MTRAFIAAADVQFPPLCVRCDGTPDTTHEIDVSRSVDLLVFAVWEGFDLPVPICSSCRRTRRMAGWASIVATIVFIFGGVFVGLQLIMDQRPILGGLFWGAALVGLIGGRMLRDGLLEWTTLGLRAKLLWRDPSIMRLSFRRPEYWTAWSGANPGAVSSHNLLPEKKIMENASDLNASFSRAKPAGLLVFALLILAAHHWYAMSQGRVITFLVLMLSAAAGLSLAGILHPPIFYAAGKYGKHLPMSFKVLAGLSAAAGLAAGFYFMITWY